MARNTTKTRLEIHHGSQASLLDGGVPKTVLFRKYQQQHPEWRLDEDEEADWSKFCGTVIDASYRALPDLGPLRASPTLKHLSVLCLRGSGVVDIELLGSCPMLVHLDLSSNAIAHLVDDDFWASFRELLVLLLHRNKVAEWRAIDNLGKAPQLTYLTLFSNPVYKRKMYRTFTTNCCESLRGLDLHAVSDEEVVEGARFFRASRCRTCSSALALPQPLFKGLTEVSFATIRYECAKTGDPISPSAGVNTVEAHPRSYPTSDTVVLRSVLLRVGLLRKFHARNSPVIIGQRQIRRFIKDRVGVDAAVKIQACARKWIVRLKAVVALKEILRERGELYLVQEMMTPVQLRSLTWFQRRIAGRFRLKVLLTCTKTLERFLVKVANRFSEIVDCLDRAQVGGVIVASGAAGELAEAVAKALVIAIPEIRWDEATERAVAMVTTVAKFRLLRPVSYVRMPDWPVLEADVTTDGVFITRSTVGGGPRAEVPDIRSNLPQKARQAPLRPFSGLREARSDSHVQRRTGIFGSSRVRECTISRRTAAGRRLLHDPTAKKCNASVSKTDSHEQLWIFRTTETRMLARVLHTLCHGSSSAPPVPCILERHLLRCASATRIQTAWRGHILRWNLLETLASCLIVARAVLCMQRWWRNKTGLGARLQLSRRMWALASAVRCPTMYMELDVFFTLTRGWGWVSEKYDIAFAFQSGGGVAMVRTRTIPTFGALQAELLNSGQEGVSDRHGRDAVGFVEAPATRDLPMWARRSVVRQVWPSDVHHRQIFHRVGSLLTQGVAVKRVVWPVAAAATWEPGKDAPFYDNNVRAVPQPIPDPGTSSESACVDGPLTSTLSEIGGETCSGKSRGSSDSPDCGPPLDLSESHGNIEMVELTFPSTEEARARALLLVLATEEPGALPDRPVAQLMTLGMLRRAAAGEPGQASPILKAPSYGYNRGDAVEVSVFRLSEGRGVAWSQGTVGGRAGNGTAFKVTLDNGWTEPHVPESCLRPCDRTGKELALVGMSHLPSRWQRTARSLVTPADRLELELLRRSLPFTTHVDHSVVEPIQLLRDTPRQAADTVVAGDLDRYSGLDGRGLVPGPRSPSQHSPVGRDDTRIGSSLVRWAGSQTMAVPKRTGGLAAEAMDKIAQAAAQADEAAACSTWVPGNRFRRDLEKLVHLAAHENQHAAEERKLSARREAISRARDAEQGGSTPRDRLEKLKAAEVALFRRESDELKNRSALENARDKIERSNNVIGARECTREGKMIAGLCLQDRLAKQLVDIKRLEDEVEEERSRALEKRRADVQTAKTRAAKRRVDRANQALCLAESNTFTANASQLARFVGKHATTSLKAQTARGMRRLVKGRNVQKEEIRQRLLRRVLELQEQKRIEATRLRKALAARGKARVAMDDAVIRHRLGLLTPTEDDLAEEVMQVMRPRSRLQELSDKNDHSGTGEENRALSPWQEEGINDVAVEHDVAENRKPETMQPKPPIGEQTIKRAGQHSIQLTNDGHADVDGIFAAAARGGAAIPSKPDAPRPRSHRRRNRRLHPNVSGKTVVVLAKVPSVAVEPRPRSTPGTASALFGSKSSRSMLSQNFQGGGGDGRGVRMPSTVPTDQALLPWPLGRRCW